MGHSAPTRARTRRPSALRYFPHVVVATGSVVALPVAVVWLLRARGAVTSTPACVVIAVALSLAASFAGSAYWKRRRHGGDILFSELLVWGWVRRLHVERQLQETVARLGHADTSERRGQLVLLADALEIQDPYTAGHSRRVARHTELISRRMGLTGDELRRVVAAAAVHDVGKLYVPLEVLHKPGRLTEEEFAVVQRHAEDGAAMVAPLGDEELTAIVRHHHERLDGAGYPSGLQGEAIPLGARIVAVADAFDAIIESRPYRPGAAHKRALDILIQESRSQFDPAVVAAFVGGYDRRRSVVPWAMLGAVGGSAVWPSGLRRVSARLNALGPVAVFALLVALAGHHAPATQAQPAHGPTAHGSIVRSTAVAKPAARTARATPRQTTPPAVTTALPHSASATCQSYSPQDCTALTSVESVQSVSTRGSGAAGAGRGGGSTAALPFTG